MLLYIPRFRLNTPYLEAELHRDQHLQWNFGTFSTCFHVFLSFFLYVAELLHLPSAARTFWEHKEYTLVVHPFLDINEIW